MRLMSNRPAITLLLAAVLLATAVTPALAQPPLVTSGQLIEEHKKWDGKTITYQGEAIGDILRRGDSAWINVNDDAYASRNIEEGGKPSGYNSGQSVWLPISLVRPVEFLGDYDTRGDVISVTGTFHAAWPEHGGDMAIEASTLEVVRRGGPIEHPLDVTKLAAAIVLLVSGAALYFANKKAELLRT
ncbi:MAG: DNA-binding protein [Actinobacteria bacterium]|nr:MAG: DNA-binding protein [Actinomycetota bacterium]